MCGANVNWLMVPACLLLAGHREARGQEGHHQPGGAEPNGLQAVVLGLFGVQPQLASLCCSSSVAQRVNK